MVWGDVSSHTSAIPRFRRPEHDDLCLRQLRPARPREQSGGGKDVDVCLRQRREHPEQDGVRLYDRKSRHGTEQSIFKKIQIVPPKNAFE